MGYRTPNIDRIACSSSTTTPERELDYTSGAEQAHARARAKEWTVVSVKEDWATVFAGPP